MLDVKIFGYHKIIRHLAYILQWNEIFGTLRDFDKNM